MGLKAGAACQDISPRAPLFLVGYPHVPRISTGIHDPLLASALFLSDGRTDLMLISVDVLFISRASADVCRSAISEACSIPRSNILISATHTHSAPVTAEMLAWRADPVVPPPDPDYMETFHRGIIRAGVEACKNAAPASVAVTFGVVDGVGCNRLSPEGPYDPNIGIIAVRAGGHIVAVDMIYGMHPTVLHEDSKVVSSDFPHYARESVRDAVPGATVVYHTAPSGNLSPRYHVSAQTFGEAERLGRRLGGSVVSALRGLDPDDFCTDLPLESLSGSAEMVPNRFQTLPEAELGLKRAREQYEQLREQGAPHGPLRTAECVVFGCEEALVLAQAQAEGTCGKLQEQYKSAEVQVFRIGNCLIAAFPGEQFVEYAMELKEKAPLRTFVISLANGELQGYIVTPETGGGATYEASFAMFAPESGRRLVDTALGLMRRISL